MSDPTLDQSINNFGKQIENMFAYIDYSPTFPKIQQVVQTSIDRNFQEGGRFGTANKYGGGSQKWKPSGGSYKRSGISKSGNFCLKFVLILRKPLPPIG